jgi:restriction endonuclease S subunit
MELPLPPREIQDEIVATLDLIYNTAKSADVMVADLKTQMATIVKVFDNKCADKTTIGTLYDTPKCAKKFNSKDMDNGGDVPFFNGKFNSPVGTHSDYSYDSDTDYFVMIKDGGGDHNSDLVGMGKFFQVTGKCAVTSHNLVLAQKMPNPQLHKFMSFYLRCNGKEIRDKANYSINLGSISVKDVLEFPVPNMSAEQFADANKRLSALESTITALETSSKQSEENARLILESYLNAA